MQFTMPDLPAGYTEVAAVPCEAYQVAACCPCGTVALVTFEERALGPAVHESTHLGMMVIAEELDASGAPTGLRVELPRMLSRVHIEAGDLDWAAEFGHARDEALKRIAALKRSRSVLAALPLKRAAAPTTKRAGS